MFVSKKILILSKGEKSLKKSGLEVGQNGITTSRIQVTGIFLIR